MPFSFAQQPSNGCSSTKMLRERHVAIFELAQAIFRLAQVLQQQPQSVCNFTSDNQLDRSEYSSGIDHDNDEQPIVINSVHSGAQQPYIASKSSRQPTASSSSSSTTTKRPPLMSSLVSHRTTGVSHGSMAVPATASMDSMTSTPLQPSQEFERQQIYQTSGTRLAPMTTRASNNATTKLPASQATHLDLVRQQVATSGAPYALHSTSTSALSSTSPSSPQQPTGIIRDFGDENSSGLDLNLRPSISLGTSAPHSPTSTTASTPWMQSVRDNHAGPLRSRFGLITTAPTYREKDNPLPPSAARLSDASAGFPRPTGSAAGVALVDGHMRAKWPAKGTLVPYEQQVKAARDDQSDGASDGLQRVDEDIDSAADTEFKFRASEKSVGKQQVDRNTSHTATTIVATTTTRAARQNSKFTRRNTMPVELGDGNVPTTPLISSSTTAATTTTTTTTSTTHKPETDLDDEKPTGLGKVVPIDETDLQVLSERHQLPVATANVEPVAHVFASSIKQNHSSSWSMSSSSTLVNNHNVAPSSTNQAKSRRKPPLSSQRRARRLMAEGRQTIPPSQPAASASESRWHSLRLLGRTLGGALRRLVANSVGSSSSTPHPLPFIPIPSDPSQAPAPSTSQHLENHAHFNGVSNLMGSQQATGNQPAAFPAAQLLAAALSAAAAATLRNPTTTTNPQAQNTMDKQSSSGGPLLKQVAASNRLHEIATRPAPVGSVGSAASPLRQHANKKIIDSIVDLPASERRAARSSRQSRATNWLASDTDANAEEAETGSDEANSEEFDVVSDSSTPAESTGEKRKSMELVAADADESMDLLPVESRTAGETYANETEEDEEDETVGDDEQAAPVTSPKGTRSSDSVEPVEEELDEEASEESETSLMYAPGSLLSDENQADDETNSDQQTSARRMDLVSVQEDFNGSEEEPSRSGVRSRREKPHPRRSQTHPNAVRPVAVADGTGSMIVTSHRSKHPQPLRVSLVRHSTTQKAGNNKPVTSELPSVMPPRAKPMKIPAPVRSEPAAAASAEELQKTSLAPMSSSINVMDPDPSMTRLAHNKLIVAKFKPNKRWQPKRGPTAGTHQAPTRSSGSSSNTRAQQVVSTETHKGVVTESALTARVADTPSSSPSSHPTGDGSLSTLATSENRGDNLSAPNVANLAAAVLGSRVITNKHITDIISRWTRPLTSSTAASSAGSNSASIRRTPSTTSTTSTTTTTTTTSTTTTSTTTTTTTTPAPSTESEPADDELGSSDFLTDFMPSVPGELSLAGRLAPQSRLPSQQSPPQKPTSTGFKSDKFNFSLVPMNNRERINPLLYPVEPAWKPPASGSVLNRKPSHSLRPMKVTPTSSTTIPPVSSTSSTTSTTARPSKPTVYTRTPQMRPKPPQARPNPHVQTPTTSTSTSTTSTTTTTTTTTSTTMRPETTQKTPIEADDEGDLFELGQTLRNQHQQSAPSAKQPSTPAPSLNDQRIGDETASLSTYLDANGESRQVMHLDPRRVSPRPSTSAWNDAFLSGHITLVDEPSQSSSLDPIEKFSMMLRPHNTSSNDAIRTYSSAHSDRNRYTTHVDPVEPTRDSGMNDIIHKWIDESDSHPIVIISDNHHSGRRRRPASSLADSTGSAQQNPSSASQWPLSMHYTNQIPALDSIKSSSSNLSLMHVSQLARRYLEEAANGTRVEPLLLDGSKLGDGKSPVQPLLFILHIDCPSNGMRDSIPKKESQNSPRKP